MRSARLVIIAVLVTMWATSCQTYGMSFTRDSRIDITSPQARAVLDLPVVVRWELSADLAEAIRTSDGEKYFAVFVDRAPVSGGKDISGMVDRECRRTPGCGGEQWFNDRGVYFTSGTSITIRDVDDRRVDRAREDKDLHRATVVVMRRAEEPVLDALLDGTRDGEGAVAVEFYIDRREP